MNKTVDDQRNFCKFVATENTKSPDDRSSFSCVLITTTEEKEGEDVDVDDDDDNSRHEESKKNFIIIGEVSFEKINQTIKTGIIGYWLATKYQGKGIASAAADSIIKYGFDIFKFDYIALQVEVENYASQAIPNRLGFERLSLESTGRITENLYGKEIVLSTYVKSSPYIVIVEEEEEKEGRIPILSIKDIDWRTAGKKNKQTKGKSNCRLYQYSITNKPMSSNISCHGNSATKYNTARKITFLALILIDFLFCDLSIKYL